MSNPVATPASVRKVILLTTNPLKLEEHRRLFQLYGLEVEQRDPIPMQLVRSKEQHCLLKEEADGPYHMLLAENGVVSVLVDETYLWKDGRCIEDWTTLRHLELVENVTNLSVFELFKENLPDEPNRLVNVRRYTERTKGYINLGHKVAYGFGHDEPIEGVFGFDQVFVVAKLGQSYHELRANGMKISSRDLAVSKYLSDRFGYKKNQDLKFQPQEWKQTIDLTKSAEDLIKSNRYLSNPWAAKMGIANVYTEVVNQGLFFRSPINRRQKNYWYPGLNAGIPFTSKADPVHEVTYMAHDFGHFAMPDLIFTGELKDVTMEQQKHIYVAFRMFGEACTMILADMLFTDTLRKDGVEYDWSKRKIYPLFQATGLSFGNTAVEAWPVLCKLVKANVNWALKGDDSAWRHLVSVEAGGTGNIQALEDFKSKYTAFMVSDYQWTVRNFNNMAREPKKFEKWWKMVHPMSYRGIGEVEFPTIKDFIDLCLPRTRVSSDPSKLIDDVAEAALHCYLRLPFLSEEPITFADRSVQMYNALLRYEMGQCMVFAQYSQVPESEWYFRGIFRMLDMHGYYPERDPDEPEYRPQLLLAHDSSTPPRKTSSITARDVEATRSFYTSFLTILQEHNLITSDDVRTYQDVYPLFSAQYVFYDEKPEFYESLASMFKWAFDA